MTSACCVRVEWDSTVGLDGIMFGYGVEMMVNRVDACWSRALFLAIFF
jgi:hypothetical protein